MDYQDKQYGFNMKDRSYILDGVSEKIITLSSVLINDWFNRIRHEYHFTTIDDMRALINTIINNNTSQFLEYLKCMNWGDCFMIDKTMFDLGGSRRVVDYPGVTPKNGVIITINGKKHSMFNVGLLTFDSFNMK
jgi:hypothetical protein